MKITKLALIGLLFAGALFTTGCGDKSPADDAAEAPAEASAEASAEAPAEAPAEDGK